MSYQIPDDIFFPALRKDFSFYYRVKSELDLAHAAGEKKMARSAKS